MTRPSIPYLLAKARATRLVSNGVTSSHSVPHLRAYANKNHSHKKEITQAELKLEVTRQFFESGKLGQKWEPQPRGVLRLLLSKVTALFLSGGGGPGRSLPEAIIKATEYGLDVKNIKVVNATSVGAIQGLMIALGCTPREMKEILIKMPTETFQDWDIKSALTFFKRWGLCRGDAMERYFKQAIKEKTDLDDPSFKELYDAGYEKEFRIIITNVTKRQMTLFSYKTTPNHKVASSVALACRLPFLFPPLWLKNEQGELEAFTDGGLVQNYPWGIACDPNMPLDEQLGFMFLNEPETLSMKDNKGRSILNSIWHYIYSLFWIVLFPNPVALPENVKQRTVKIRVPDHSVFNFNASFDEQKYLDKCADRAVKDYVRELIEYKLPSSQKTLLNNKKGGNFRDLPTPLPAYYLAKHRLKARPVTSVAEQNIRSRVRP